MQVHNYVILIGVSFSSGQRAPRLHRHQHAAPGRPGRLGAAEALAGRTFAILSNNFMLLLNKAIPLKGFREAGEGVDGQNGGGMTPLAHCHSIVHVVSMLLYYM